MSRVPDDLRPATAQWLIEARSDAGFTNAKDFLAAVKEAEGSAPSYSTYAQWESGSVTPRKVSLAPIRRFHAARQPAPEPTTVTETPDPTAVLISAMTGALTELVAELKATREERKRYEDRLAAVERGFERLAERLLLEPEDEGSPGRSVPHGTAG